MASAHSAVLTLGRLSLSRATGADMSLAPAPCGPDVGRLGEQLMRRSEDLALCVASCAGEPGEQLREAFALLASIWTTAVARWMLGEGEGAARESGQQCLRIFGELAGGRVAPVDRIVRLCLRWRDAAGEIAQSSARDLALDAGALAQVTAMLQRSLDVTLVRLCEAFEAERRRGDEELRFLATHDVVTGLPNRTLISQRLTEMLEQAHRGRTSVALLFIDVDNFKVVNDTLGHPAGDELLRAVTARLREVVRERDSLGRFGGDEFVVIVEEMSSAQSAERVAQRVLDAFAEPFILLDGSARLSVSASVGVALAERATVDELLREADIAMYRAKGAGKNRYALISARS